MKKLIMVALLAIGVSSFAQNSTTLEQRTDSKVKQLASDLDLSNKQQKQVKSLLQETQTKIIAKTTASRQNSGTQPRADRLAVLQKDLNVEYKAYDTKMKSILSPNQYTKWQAIRTANKKKLRAEINKKLQESKKE